MSDHLLLKLREQCPICRHPNGVKGYGQCRNCGMWLFEQQHDVDKFVEDTGWRELWVFNTQLGWMHWTQYKNPQALERAYVPDKLPDDYGTKTAEQRAAEAVADARRVKE